MKFFAPNIGRAGRLVRAAYGIACIAAGAWLCGHSHWLGGALIAAGVFGLFEAARGWCLVRACGIKTKI